MSKDPVGISNLWSTPDRVKPDPAKAVKEIEVRYPGRAYAIVVTLHGKLGDDSEVEAAAEKQLGETLQKLWQHPFIKGQGEMLHIYTREPLNPKVTFDFGDFKLFGSAASLVPDTAQAMALDRLALVLTTVSNRPELAAILTAGRCEVRSIR